MHINIHREHMDIALTHGLPMMTKGLHVHIWEKWLIIDNFQPTIATVALLRNCMWLLAMHPSHLPPHAPCYTPSSFVLVLSPLSGIKGDQGERGEGEGGKGERGRSFP